MPSQSSHTKTSATIHTLYGQNGATSKAKAKSSRGLVSNPGFETNNSMHTATSTLYGTGSDSSKATLKASGGSSRYLGAPSISTTESAVDTLYGSDADAKARARTICRGAAAPSVAVPGAERLAPQTTTNERTNQDAAEHERSTLVELVARPVSVEVVHTDSETESTSEPERTVRAGRHGLSSEVRDTLQLPNDPEMPSHRRDKSEMEGAQEEEKKSKKKRCILLLLFLLLLLIGAGVALWYFLFRNDSGAEESQFGNSNIEDVQDATQSPSSNVSTVSPTEPSHFGNSTMFPTSAPSKRFIYDPPSESDCQYIAANKTIAGRETMENADFELGIEVVLPENNTLTDLLLQDLLDAIQRKILPSLAGCSIIIDEFLEAWRFVIFDAFVTGSIPSDESCTDEVLMKLNCRRVSVNLDLFLKGKVRFIDILGLITDQGENIANHLELEEQFSIIKLIGAESLVPTDAPTTMPSVAPSFSPTESPTAEASSNPTGIPSVLPTRARTRAPSLSPTSLPTESPSMFPITTRPTEDPSAQPTPAPSRNPTVAPTRAPTPRPTTRPTKSPTMVPTRVPSVSPTDKPSQSPSQSPTKFPTLVPSQKPTGSPSEVPTPQPSVSPTPAYPVEIITQAYGPYTNYPVSQSTTGFGGEAIRAIDGNNNGGFYEGSVTHTQCWAPGAHWWQIDMATGAGKPVVVKHITIWNRSDSTHGERLDGAVLQLLDANQIDITPPSVDNVLTGDREQTVDFGLVSDVSFIKIQQENNVLSLAEVEIYGYVPP